MIRCSIQSEVPCLQPKQNLYWLGIVILGLMLQHILEYVFRNTKPAQVDTADIKITDSNHGTTTLASSTATNSEEQVQITTFQDVEVPQVVVTTMEQDTSDINDMDDTVSIAKFLQRPVKLDSIKLTPTTTANRLRSIVTTTPQQPLWSADLPSRLLNIGGKGQKIANHHFFKADVHIKVVVNTNPFVSGRFYLTYSPYEDTVVKPRQQKWASRSGVTAYPGVELDLQIDNSVEIIVPYASYKEAYVLVGEPENFVKLSLYTVVPILGTDDAQADLTVYGWFENIVVNMPTYRIASEEKHEKRTQLVNKIFSLQQVSPSVYQYIMKSIGYDDKQAEAISVELQTQAEAKEPGPVQQIAGTVGAIAGALTAVPVVNEIAAPIAWIANIASGIASVFGWSRPNSYTHVAPFQNVPGKFYAHVSTEDQSVALALDNTNELGALSDVFPSAIDEMDLGYVCANPAIKYVEIWPAMKNSRAEARNAPILVIPCGLGTFTGQLLESQTIVYSTAVKKTAFDSAGFQGQWNPCHTMQYRGQIPFEAYKLRAAQTAICGDLPACIANPIEVYAEGKAQNVILDTAPCEYVSQLFKYWRATLCFKISVVKTAFHTGRLEIFFEPGMYRYKNDGLFTPELDAYTLVDTTNNYKYILDLTNESEVTIRIPYISEKLFKLTQGINGGNAAPTLEQVQDSIIGALIIRPVSHLMAPETVAQKVEVVVWKWAEDVVLMCPTTASGADLAIYRANSVKKFAEGTVNFETIPFEITSKLTVHQIEESKPTEKPKVDKAKPRKPRDIEEVELQINVGNSASGNSQTFFNVSNIEQLNMDACKRAGGERIINLRPLLRCFRDWKQAQGNDVLRFQDESQVIDYISYLSYMYRFFRGGVRYKIFEGSKDTNDDQRTITWLHSGAAKNTNMTPSHVTYTKLNPVHEVSVPYYSQYRKLPLSLDSSLMNVTCKTRPGNFIMRSGDDNLTYGWLMGTPQIMTSSGSVNWHTLHVKQGDDIPREEHQFPKGACQYQQDGFTVAESGYKGPTQNVGPISVQLQMDVPDSFSLYHNHEIEEQCTASCLAFPTVRAKRGLSLERVYQNDDLPLCDVIKTHVPAIEKEHRIMRRYFANIFPGNENSARRNLYCAFQAYERSVEQLFYIYFRLKIANKPPTGTDASTPIVKDLEKDIKPYLTIYEQAVYDIYHACSDQEEVISILRPLTSALVDFHHNMNCWMNAIVSRKCES